MLYSCTHMMTVGVKVLRILFVFLLLPFTVNKDELCNKPLPAKVNQIATRLPCHSQPAAAKPCAINSNTINSIGLGCS